MFSQNKRLVIIRLHEEVICKLVNKPEMTCGRKHFEHLRLSPASGKAQK